MPKLSELMKPTPTLAELRRQELTTPAWHYFKKADKARLAEILRKLEVAFDRYVASKTDKDGNVLVAKQGGLLTGMATYEGLEFFGTVEKKRATEVKPHECAGPYVQDEISLLLTLWADRFPPAQEVFNEYGLAEVISLVAILYEKPASIESLIHVNSIISSLLGASAEYWEQTALEAARSLKSTTKQDMRALSKLAVAARQREAVDRGECLRIAAYYKRDHPRAKKPEIANYVCSKKPGLGFTTAMRYIAGYEQMWRKMN